MPVNIPRNTLPEVLASNLNLGFEEVGYLLYLPISLADSSVLHLPDYPFLQPARAIIEVVRARDPERFRADYVYLTFKRMIVGPAITPNRPGWHCDGFGTDDLNYVWYDSVPTVFSKSEFRDISDDHILSLQQLEQQALEEDNWVFPNNSVLRLTPQHVHRVNLPTREAMRTFVKISVSRDKYNLKGNSTNPWLVGKPWQTYERALVRNDPHLAQRDTYTPKDDHLV